jgi:hypothetical protein
LRAREDQDGIGIELFSGHHGSQRIKIGIDMGGDYFHNNIELIIKGSSKN